MKEFSLNGVRGVCTRSDFYPFMPLHATFRPPLRQGAAILALA